MSFEEYWAKHWESASLSGTLGRLTKDIAHHAWKHAMLERDNSAQVAHLQNVIDAYEITERTAL